MNTDKKRITDIIRADLLTMNGGKNSQRTMLIICCIFFGVLGLIFSPLVGLYIPLLMGGCFVPMLFRNEVKFHSEKLFALLPVSRKDIVRSRFIFSVGAYLLATGVFYLLMLLSVRLNLIRMLVDEENLDVLQLLAKSSGGTMTRVGVFNMWYFAASFFGLNLVVRGLRSYFRDSSRLENTLRKADKHDYKLFVVSAFLIIGLVIFVTDLLPVRAALAPVGAVLIQLFSAANGFLMGAVLSVMGVMSAIHKYICTLLEYEEKEL